MCLLNLLLRGLWILGLILGLILRLILGLSVLNEPRLGLLYSFDFNSFADFLVLWLFLSILLI